MATKALNGKFTFAWQMQ